MPKTRLICHHLKILCKKSKQIYYCSKCYSLFLITETQNEISTFKYKNDNFLIENKPKIFESIDSFRPNSFLNKKDFLELRQGIVKKMKEIKNKFQLHFKTYFLALSYFETICSQIYRFTKDSLLQISKFCLILSAKFSEDGEKASNLENELKKNLSSNYKNDEIYILKLLNYNLNVITSYDLLMESINIGFILNDEKYSKKKLKVIYNHIEKMLFAFSESKFFFGLNPKIIVISLLSFIRELLGLKNLTEFFIKNNGKVYEKELEDCLCKIRICLKVKNNNVQSNNNEL
jgi:hypothetical protein